MITNEISKRVACAGHRLERTLRARVLVVRTLEALMAIPILQIRKTEAGAWAVHVEFPGGGFEEISGFKSENEANRWIAEELQEWLDRRESHRLSSTKA